MSGVARFLLGFQDFRVIEDLLEHIVEVGLLLGRLIIPGSLDSLLAYLGSVAVFAEVDDIGGFRHGYGSCDGVWVSSRQTLPLDVKNATSSGDHESREGTRAVPIQDLAYHQTGRLPGMTGWVLSGQTCAQD